MFPLLNLHATIELCYDALQDHLKTHRQVCWSRLEIKVAGMKISMLVHYVVCSEGRRRALQRVRHRRSGSNFQYDALLSERGTRQTWRTAHKSSNMWVFSQAELYIHARGQKIIIHTERVFSFFLFCDDFVLISSQNHSDRQMMVYVCCAVVVFNVWSWWIWDEHGHVLFSLFYYLNTLTFGQTIISFIWAE